MVRHRRSPRPRIFIRGIGFPALTCRKAGRLRLQTRRLIARIQRRCQIGQRRRPTDASRAASTCDVQRKLKRNFYPAFTTVPRPSKRTEPAANRMRAERYRGGTPDFFAAVMLNRSMTVFQTDRPGATPGCRTSFGLQPLQRCSGLLNRRARGSTVVTHQVASRWAGGQVRKWEEQNEGSLSVSPLPTFPLSHLLSAQPAWLSSDSSSFVNCRAIAPRECESLRRLQFSEGG